MNSKVHRLIETYELPKIDEQLLNYWTREDDKQRSLRELADYFNKKLLHAAMSSAGMTTLNGEVRNIYRLLTTDGVSPGVRSQTETILERNGINPNQIQRDFVSHQAIHTYLTEHRGVQHQSETSEQDRVADAENTIQRLKGRLVAVAEKRLESLRDAETITLGTFSVLVDVRVVCEDCGTHTDVPTLLSKRGCDCNSDR